MIDELIEMQSLSRKIITTTVVPICTNITYYDLEQLKHETWLDLFWNRR